MISGYRCDVKKGLSKDEMNKVIEQREGQEILSFKGFKQQQRDMGNRQGRSRGPDPRAGGGKHNSSISHYSMELGLKEGSETEFNS